ncbi:hypothetical protein PSAC2689_50306 [Paraburkholderia sacchari]
MDAIDMSYIRHKILLTLPLPAPKLPVEQGFAGDSEGWQAAYTSWRNVSQNRPAHAVPPCSRVIWRPACGRAARCAKASHAARNKVRRIHERLV